MAKGRKRGKVMFSAVSGRVLLEGVPLANQEIRQSFGWLGVDGGDATTETDTDGYYSFPTVISYEKQPRNEKDIFINQRISTIHDDHTVTLWTATKYEFLDGSELGGVPIRLVHELTAESRSYQIPGLGRYPTSIDGVLELDHPYVVDFERAKALVEGAMDELTGQLVTALNAPDLLELVNRQFVTPVFLPHPIRLVEAVLEPECSSFALYKDPGHAVPSATDYRYVGFNLSGKLAVRDSAGGTWELRFYWPGASLSLTTGPEVPPRLAGRLSLLQVYSRDLLRDRVGHYLKPEAVADHVYELIAARPPTELAYVLDDRLSIADLEYDGRELPEGYEPGYRVNDFVIETASPSYVVVESDYLSVKACGRFALDGHSRRYPFTAFFCLSLSAMGQGRCEQVENTDCPVLFRVPTFDYSLRMDRPEVSADDPVIMHFTVTNRLPKTNIFLIWHTPFEGFQNEFLDIVHLESGTELQYEGMLASRVPPSRESGSYLELEAEASRSATIDLRDAYTFTRPGTYRVTFRQLGGRDDDHPASTEFVLQKSEERESGT
jgi:hypothetical protein